MVVLEVALTDNPLRGRYDDLLEACPGAFIQQSTCWGEVIQDLGPDKPIFLLYRDGDEDIAGLPLYLFEHRLGNLLTSVPQPGPLGGVFVKESLDPGQKAEAYRCLLEAALALAARHQCLTLTCITNPFCDDRELYDRYLSPTFIFENFTQFVPLDQAARRSGGQRNNLARARKFGFAVEPCATREELAHWHELHCRRQQEVGAAVHDFRLYENIFRVLGPRNEALFLQAKHEDALAAGCLVVGHNDVVDVFAITMNSAYKEHAPNSLTLDFALTWAVERGARIFNWQSSASRDSGVYNFKKQWGSVESTYCFMTRLLCDPGRIASLGRETIQKEYPWHYVVPFAAFDEGFDRKHFRKA